MALAKTSAPPRLRISAAAVCNVLSVRAHMATMAPSAANASAHARPMPWLAPATSTTLPLSPVSIVLAFSLALAARKRGVGDIHASRRRRLHAFFAEDFLDPPAKLPAHLPLPSRLH